MKADIKFWSWENNIIKIMLITSKARDKTIIIKIKSKKKTKSKYYAENSEVIRENQNRYNLNNREWNWYKINRVIIILKIVTWYKNNRGSILWQYQYHDDKNIDTNRDKMVSYYIQNRK